MPMWWSIARIVVTVLTAISVYDGSASAQQTRLACGQGLVEQQSPNLRQRAIARATMESEMVSIQFIGHATFVVRSPQSVNVITDYNDYYRTDVMPDIATMNTNRSNHSTFHIEPGVKYPLYGWDTGAGIPHHDITYKDVRVYSEPTNIFAMGDRNTNETAIFVIQVAGLCIAHLGHTAHVLDEDLVRRLGTIDIVMSPVDRIVTQSYDEIFYNLRLLKPGIVIPMHDIGWTTQQFLTEAQRQFPIRRDLGDAIQVRRDMLPGDTEIWVLQPRARSGGTY